MSSSEANELVATFGSQKKMWTSWKDKIEGKEKREKRKESQYKQTKTHDIIFSDISPFGTQIFVVGWYCGVVTKIEFKTKVHNYKHNRWLQR